MKRIVRSALVQRSPAEMYALVERIEDYPAFLPWCQGVEVQSRTAGETLATITVGVRGVRYAFTTRNRNRPGEAIEMQLVRGPFRAFEGGWSFHALALDACRIEFSLAYEFSNRMVALALGRLMESMADSMVEAFSRRAESRR